MTIKTQVTDKPVLDALAAIHNDAFEKNWDAAAIRDLLSVAGTMVFVAAGDAGFGLLRHLGEDAEMLTLAVLPAHQRRGIGAAIVRTMRQWAREQGAKAVFLEVSEHNTAAIRLYEDNGFSVFSRRREYYQRADGAHEHALVMRCVL